MSLGDKIYMSYNNVHRSCQKIARKIIETNNRPDVIVAITGGGMIPARIIRSFLKNPGQKKIPIQAIGLSLYDEESESEEIVGKEVVRTQWLDFGALNERFDSLIGKNILIVDEIDDTRTTLNYAVTELEKEIEEQQIKLNRMNEKTIFSIFVLHNKDKPKRAVLPAHIMETGRYFAAEVVPDKWLCYPWDAIDVDEHTQYAIEQGRD